MTAPATGQATDPHLLAAMRGLELSARRLAAGVVSGQHASRQPGPSREFGQYRSYQPGDDIRRIDWKLFARSDRYYVREGEIDSRLRLNLVVDATASMKQSGVPAAGKSKFDAARQVASALAWLAMQQGDTVALHLVADGKVRSVLPGTHGPATARIFRALAGSQPAGQWPKAAASLTAALRSGGVGSAAAHTTAELTVILTDGFEHGEEIRDALAPLRGLRHEVLFIQLISPDELEFAHRGPVRFVDLESGTAIETDASAARAGYLEGQARERDRWRQAWRGSRFDYLALAVNEPLDRPLRLYLRRRGGAS